MSAMKHVVSPRPKPYYTLLHSGEANVMTAIRINTPQQHCRRHPRKHEKHHFRRKMSTVKINTRIESSNRRWIIHAKHGTHAQKWCQIPNLCRNPHDGKIQVLEKIGHFQFRFIDIRGEKYAAAGIYKRGHPRTRILAKTLLLFINVVYVNKCLRRTRKGLHRPGEATPTRFNCASN